VREDFAAYFLKAGSEFYKNKRFEDAANCYERAIAINPLIPESWYERGLVLYKLGSYEEALQSFEGALNIDKRYVDAWNNKGVTLDKLGRYEEAVNCYGAILKINRGIRRPGKMKVSLEESLANISRHLPASITLPRSIPGTFPAGVQRLRFFTSTWAAMRKQ